ncbi:ABC transporter [Actinoplanes regularis]|uniref:ABC transporter n=1 Tax=Actinoplanes regularis TaxID=52697 RepID=A0A238YXL6_9ACTN|nr:hypothetical protein Are01nite_21220 [Actinoplanes regularis]SNR75837.1 ABC transporter [Actinoplanes regularis]
MCREAWSAVIDPCRPKGLPDVRACAVELTKRYGRLTALGTLSLDVQPGEVFGSLGPNGAGKSTTICLLLGLARPTAGRAEGFDVDAADVARAHALLAYVLADVALWPQLTGAEILHLQARTGPGTDPAFRDELVDRFQLGLSKPART